MVIISSSLTMDVVTTKQHLTHSSILTQLKESKLECFTSDSKIFFFSYNTQYN